jgi:hypothetical protein
MKRPEGRPHRAAVVATSCSAAMLVLSPVSAIAGAPFRTDDPQPVELGHYEFYTFSTGMVVSGHTPGFLPAFEFNYGLIPDGQLHIVAPVAFDSVSGGPTQFGYGDTELGFKYRFVNEDKDGWMPQVGTQPLLEVPTGDESRGLGAGHVRAFFPVWLQKSFGDWTTYGGGGYWINHAAATHDQDYWFFGWVLQRKISDKLTFGGEIFHQTANKIEGRAGTGLNLGALYDIDDHRHIVFSAGRGIQNASETNRFSWYIGYQITGP